MTSSDSSMTNLPQTNVLEVPTKLPVFWFSMHEHLRELQLARIAINEVRISHPDNTPSNVQAIYMSPWKSHTLNDKFLPLCSLVEALAKKVSVELLKADLPTMNLELKVTDCWGVIYEKSDYTKPHMHYPFDLSAVIYLETDESSAPIIFGDGISVQPKSGLLVMFPGILLHQVPENHGKRVVIAMNLLKLPKFG